MQGGDYNRKSVSDVILSVVGMYMSGKTKIAKQYTYHHITRVEVGQSPRQHTAYTVTQQRLRCSPLAEMSLEFLQQNRLDTFGRMLLDFLQHTAFCLSNCQRRPIVFLHSQINDISKGIQLKECPSRRISLNMRCFSYDIL